MATRPRSTLVSKKTPGSSSFTPAVKPAAPPAAAKPGGTQPGTGTAPATPPSAKPFMGPAEYAAVAAHLQGNTMSQIEADYGLAQTAANSAYQKQVNDRNARFASRDANDAAGARGIYGSSINQGDLADIEGQRQRANDNLDAQLAASQLHHNAVIAAITNVAVGSPEWNFWQGINAGQVQNATDINNQVTPDQMQVADPAASAAPAQQAKPAPSAASAAQTAQQKAQQSPRPSGSQWQGSNVFQQTTGPRAGQWYRVEKRGGASYRVYQNGETIKIA